MKVYLRELGNRNRIPTCEAEQQQVGSYTDHFPRYSHQFGSQTRLTKLICPWHDCRPSNLDVPKRMLQGENIASRLKIFPESVLTYLPPHQTSACRNDRNYLCLFRSPS